MTFTVYRSHIDLIPGDLITPELWSVELISHTSDGKQVNFVGEYFMREDADTIAAAWRQEATRKIVFLSAALELPKWLDNQTQGETK